MFLTLVINYVGVVNVSAEFSQFSPPNVDYSRIINSLNASAIEDHLKFFASQSSRVTGYPGCEAAARYIYEHFENLGLNPFYFNYTVTIPVDYGANFSIIVDGRYKNFKIYPLEPNLVAPVSTPELYGPLIYVGEGELKDLDGKPIEGSILLMKFNSGRNWLEAAKFGAKAVIFIEPEETTKIECMQKYVNVPLNFPRFYIKKKEAQKLLSMMQRSNEPLTARISSRMVWEQRIGKNIVALVEGTHYKDQIILVSAHYDSYSVVPSIAPGANDAAGISVLLELARLLTIYKPKYTILLVAFSGHHQTLAGVRHFLNYTFYGNNNAPTEIGKRIILQVDIQISTITDTVLAIYHGTLFGQPSQPTWFLDMDRYLKNYLFPSIVSKTNKGYKLSLVDPQDPYALPNHFPLHLKMLESEIMVYEGRAGYSLVTEDNSDYWSSPIDTFDRINLYNLRRNAEQSICAIYGIISTDDLKSKYLRSFVFGEQPYGYTGTGQIVEYNYTTNWYDPIPNALVAFDTGSERFLVAKADEEGRFSIPMITRSITGGTWFTGRKIQLYAFVVNNTDGNLLYAPTFGKYSWIYRVEFGGFYVLFKCSTVILFDTIYPFSLTTLGTGVTAVPRSFKVLNRQTLFSTDSYGFSVFEDYPSMQSFSVIYVPPQEPIVIVYQYSYDPFPVGILVNATKEETAWRGYIFEPGKQYIFHNTPLQFAINLHANNRHYLNELIKSRIPSQTYVSAYIETEKLIKKAEDALSNYEYSKAYTISMQAWIQSRVTYTTLRTTYTDIINTVPFYAFLLVPFTFLFERLLFHAQGKKRIISLLITFFIFSFIFSLMHPGFILASNPMMVVMAFVILIMITPSIYMIFTYLHKSLKNLMVKTKGLHIVEISRASASILSIQVSIENMRRRKLLTGLTIFTIILIVIGIVLFSSLSAIKVVRLKATPYPAAPYEGIFIRDDEWDSIGVNIIKLLEGYSDRAKILIRSWLYTRSPGIEAGFRVTHGNRSVYCYALTGLSGDYEPWWIHGNFTGRYFIPEDINVCILPSIIADELGVSIGDSVQLLDRNLTVVGIVGTKFLQATYDLDGEEFTPLDRTIPEQTYIHNSESTVIVPRNFIKHYNPIIAAVSVIPYDPNDIQLISEEISKYFSEISTLSASNGVRVRYFLGDVFTILGWQTQIVPIILSSLILFNVLIANIKAREREIHVFSTVGLSPLHIAFMFLAEALVYAVVGSVTGYIIVMGIWSLVPTAELTLMPINFSSSWVTTTISLIMLVTILSSIYPILKASKIVTPSLERAWKIPTNPVGDSWEIPLPITLSGDKEVYGACRYLIEYLKSHVGEVGSFSSQNLRFSDEQKTKTISMDTRLAPYELGVKQNATIYFVKSASENRWYTSIVLHRTSGEYASWVRLVRRFIDDIRKQLLLWQTLPSKEKTKYIEME